jgi:6-carboxyhexanoate--CoA ligase
MSVVQEYIDRAISHPRGRADRITITIEKINQKPILISSLPLVTAECRDISQAEDIIQQLLSSNSIDEKAINRALGIVYGKNAMRGASLMLSGSGKRTEPDRQRGTRVSHMGIGSNALRGLSLELQRHGINMQTVQEALVLASKVSSCGDIIAELCVSDDPDYTTGYVASRHTGYVRIPHIKKKGSKSGGRVLFIREDADPGPVFEYLEKTPVIINRISPCKGEMNIDEILDCNYQ